MRISKIVTGLKLLMLLGSEEVSAADFDEGLDCKFRHQLTHTLGMQPPDGGYD